MEITATMDPRIGSAQQQQDREHDQTSGTQGADDGVAQEGRHPTILPHD
jgi:hypothetical protein